MKTNVSKWLWLIWLLILGCTYAHLTVCPTRAYDAQGDTIIGYDAASIHSRTYDGNLVLSENSSGLDSTSARTIFGQFPSFLAAETTAADSPMITVLGSGRDVAPYVGQPGFNTFTGAGIPAAELDTQNALWLNNAIQSGDQIWLVTDPAAHQALMNQLNLQSAYLNLELPMLEYSGVNAIPKFVPPATAGVP
jgi:hypothetical protein